MITYCVYTETLTMEKGLAQKRPRTLPHRSGEDVSQEKNVNGFLFATIKEIVLDGPLHGNSPIVDLAGKLCVYKKKLFNREC